MQCLRSLRRRCCICRKAFFGGGVKGEMREVRREGLVDERHVVA